MPSHCSGPSGSCDVHLSPPAPPLLHFRVEPAGAEFTLSEAEVLREQALRLASSNMLDAALPLFEAIAKAHPIANYLSDLGVTWMRMGAWAQAWGSLSKALAINASHTHAQENIDELRRYLGDEHDVVVKNSLSPPRRAPRKRKHRVSPVARLGSLPPPGHDLEWWRMPIVLTGGVASDAVLEHVLASRLAHRDATYYAGGRVHFQSHVETRPVVSALRLLKTPSATAGRALARIGLDGASGEFNATLSALGVGVPDVDNLHPRALRPAGQCLETLKSANVLMAYDRLVHRRGIVLAASPGAGQYLRRDRFGTANWQLQLRGSTRWVLCPGGPSSVAASCANDSHASAASINAFDPNYELLCPGFQQAQCLEASVNAGEAIYYPPPWWVQSQSASYASVAVEASVVTHENAKAVARRLRDLCASRRTGPWDAAWGVGAGEADKLCDALPACLDKQGASVPPPAALVEAEQISALREWQM